MRSQYSACYKIIGSLFLVNDGRHQEEWMRREVSQPWWPPVWHVDVEMMENDVPCVRRIMDCNHPQATPSGQTAEGIWILKYIRALRFPQKSFQSIINNSPHTNTLLNSSKNNSSINHQTCLTLCKHRHLSLDWLGLVINPSLMQKIQAQRIRRASLRESDPPIPKIIHPSRWGEHLWRSRQSLRGRPAVRG